MSQIKPSSSRRRATWHFYRTILSILREDFANSMCHVFWLLWVLKAMTMWGRNYSTHDYGSTFSWWLWIPNPAVTAKQCYISHPLEEWSPLPYWGPPVMHHWNKTHSLSPSPRIYTTGSGIPMVTGLKCMLTAVCHFTAHTLTTSSR